MIAKTILNKILTLVVLVMYLIDCVECSLPIGYLWKQIGLDIDGKNSFDRFGYSVSLSTDGTTVAISAPFNVRNSNDAGHVRVYMISSGSWDQIGQDIEGEAASDSSGYSVSLSSDGKTIAIGAPNNYGSGTRAGHVRVYKILSGKWTQIGQDIDGESDGDNFGYSVSMSADGATVAIGAPYNDGNGSNNVGRVRIFTILADTWVQVGQDIDGESDGDNSGNSVSLSADGTTVAIGAPVNSGSGQLAGHVRVYTISSDTWVTVGQDIDGESASDNSGYSVSLSADGTTVAIGAPYNGGSGKFYSGHVRIYKYNLPTKSPTKSPTNTPTKSPTPQPTKSPTNNPTKPPTKSPTNSPTKIPTNLPTKTPTKVPTKTPTNSPTKTPTKLPTNSPTKRPTNFPTKTPTKSPTKTPTNSPTKSPLKYSTKWPVSQAPLNVEPVNTPVSVPIMVTLVPISQPVQQIPIPTPVSGIVPILIPTPIQVPVVLFNTTKSPTSIIITTDESTNCGLLGLSFFCPRVGKCGFWRRLLNIGDC